MRNMILSFTKVVLPHLTLFTDETLFDWAGLSLAARADPSRVRSRQEARAHVISHAGFAGMAACGNEASELWKHPEVQALFKSTSLETYSFGPETAIVISPPEPMFPQESFFVVILVRTDQPRYPGFPSDPFHFFTFEKCADSSKVMLCETIGGSVRRNFGLVARPESCLAAAQAVLECCDRSYPARSFYPWPRRSPHPDYASGDPFASNKRGEEHFNSYDFDSLPELLKHFDQQSGRCPARYAYRGQIDRSRLLKYTDLEALIPSDLRFLTELDADPDTSEITRKRDVNRDRRDAFFDRLVDRAKSGDSRFKWFKEVVEEAEGSRKSLFQPTILSALESSQTEIEASADDLDSVLETTMKDALRRHEKWLFRAAWSLAQHYCVSTSLLDLTSHPHVAAWFATNRWSAEPPPTRGQGVIYQFDLLALSQLFEKINVHHSAERARRGELPPTKLYIVSIAKIPEAFAMRPSAQHGLSLYGFDRFQAVDLAFGAGFVKPYTFPHGEPFESESASRAKIQPKDDPFLPFVKEFEALQSR
ncbi:MAG: hypothetical protein K0Q43_5385 [Ramlibacter sp.]|nr:hypothetical protein [Ramlibacter sp.]